MHAASIASPWNGQPMGWLQLAALGLLVWRLQALSDGWQAAAMGWVFATAWLGGTFWWMFVAMHTYAGLAAWMAALAVWALAAVLALYYGAACGLFVVWRPDHPLGAAVLFAALWMLAELARGTWFTGFGWGAAAYAHVDGLAHAAKYIGAYGVGAMAACMAYLFAASLRAPTRARGAGLLLCALGMAGWMARAPGQFSASTGRLAVALLQGNIAQDEKFQPGTGIADALRWYGEQLGRSAAPLVVAPETAIPLLPQQLPEGYWAGLRQRFENGTQAALVGIPMGNASQGYTNSVVGFKPGPLAATDAAPAYRYDKHHLVPFGEFIPPLFKWFTDLMNIPLGDFNRGGVGQPSFDWQGQRLAPNVCYEDLFGEELGTRFLAPATAPTIFVNLSNIAWFGNTVAIDQHLQISRMRVLEFERPFIRATNTGDTVIIDFAGRVTHALPRAQRGILEGEVEGRTGVTPYAWWVSRFGLAPLWMLGALAVVLAVRARRRRSTQGLAPTAGGTIQPGEGP